MSDPPPVAGAPRALVTVGHGLHPAEEFGSLLRGAGVVAVVDIRTAPGSRRAPHFGRAELARWLPEAGVSYRWEPRLGGFRKPPRPSPDTALRNPSFQGYAAHMRTAEFTAAIAEVAAQAQGEPTAVMCSESVWWRCHRRLVADHVQLVEGLPVHHVLPGGRIEDHAPTQGVRVAGGYLVYDAGAVPLGDAGKAGAPQPGSCQPGNGG